MENRPTFERLGACYQLVVEKAENLAHVAALDEALWMATSVPVDTLTCDPAFLNFVDSDRNGRIRTDEIRESISWLFRMLSDRSRVGQTGSALRLESIDTSHSEGAILQAAARRILSNIGAGAADEITLAQVRDRQKIMSGATSNGDGVIPPEAVEKDDPDLAAFMRDLVAHLGSAADAGGQPGVSSEILAAFRDQGRAHLEWLERGRIPAGQGTTDVMVWGAETHAAYEPVAALWDKLDEYFALCALSLIDERVCGRYRLSETEVAELTTNDRVSLEERLRAAPLAPPSADEVLDVAGPVNPAYRRELERLSERVVLRVSGRGGRRLTRANWEEIKRIFAPCREWLASDRGKALAPLGEEKLRCYLDGAMPEALQGLIDRDRAVAEELREVHGVEKLILFQQWLLELVNNTVSMPHFYDPDRRALVEMGTLVLDGRHFTLNVKVTDREAHKRVAARSHICLLYVEVSEKSSQTRFEVATAVTAGTTETLCIGKPGVFFTTDGREWDARVVDLLPNPVSLGEALKHPFKKFASFLGTQWERLTSRFYADTEKTLGRTLDASGAPVPAAPKPGKTTAARDLLLGGGVAFAALGGVATYLTKTIAEVGPLGIIEVVGTVALIILATTVISAVFKLRRRSLSMVLEASGWAVNTHMRLSRRIGAIFTYAPTHPPGSRIRRRDRIGALLRKVPARAHGPATWILAALLAAALGVGAGLWGAPWLTEKLVRYLGVEAAMPEFWMLRRERMRLRRRTPPARRGSGTGAVPGREPVSPPS